MRALLPVLCVLLAIAAMSCSAIGQRSVYDEPPVVHYGQGPVVEIRDHPTPEGLFVHTFFQVWDGREWTRYDKISGKGDLDPYTRQVSHLRKLEGYYERGRSRGVLRGEEAKRVVLLLELRFLRPGALSYSSPNNNSNTWAAQVLLDAGVNPSKYMSGAALGRHAADEKR